jgi:hypothetical protein
VGNYSWDSSSSISSRIDSVKGLIYLLQFKMRQSKNKKRHSFLQNQIRHFEKLVDKLTEIKMLMKHRSNS